MPTGSDKPMATNSRFHKEGLRALVFTYDFLHLGFGVGFIFIDKVVIDDAIKVPRNG